LKSAKAVGDAEVESAANRHLARMYLYRDIGESQRYADSARNAARRHGFAHERLLNLCLQGEIEAARSNWGGAREEFQAALAMAEKAGFPWAKSLSLLSLALVETKCNHVNEALELARKAPGEGYARLSSRKADVMRYLQAIQGGQDAGTAYEELRQGEFRWLPSE
jgi:hypothetical protein